jgi:NAD(P)-dependent dehydrogenase (short-subunit alcohol dehydrogenase family)
MRNGLLTDTVAVVTGGAGGIGEGISLALAEHGADLVVVDVDAERCATVVDRLVAAGGEALGIVEDVTVDGVADDVVAATLEQFGHLDVLVNNVGHYLRGGRTFAATEPELWSRLHDVNLGHVMAMSHAAIPAMIDTARNASIINLTTVEATRGIPLQSVYGAYKAAVAHFTRCLALDLSEYGIRVNSIAPDVTRSLQLPYDEWLAPDELAHVADWVPLGRFGEPADVGGVAVFLASQLSSFVTGASIPVDGGTGIAGGWYRSHHVPQGWTNRPHDA